MRIFNQWRPIIWVVLIAFLTSLLPNVGQCAAPASKAEGKEGDTAKRKLAVIHFFNATDEQRLMRDIENRLRQKFKQFGDARFRIYNEQAVSLFMLPNDQGMTAYQPVKYADAVNKMQKAFLDEITQKNEIDVLFLGSLMREDEDFVLSGQLYDRQNGVFTKMESLRFRNEANQIANGTTELVKRLLAYVDPDGWVNTAPFFGSPAEGGAASASGSSDQQVAYADETTNTGRKIEAIDYRKFETQGLAGDVNYAGEERRFWEQWWFWTIVGAVTAAGAGVGAYYLVKPKEDDQIEVLVIKQDASQVGGASGN